MLQQTQVSRVVDYYERFLRRFPTLSALADAPPRRVRETWEGLGYYARARNLHALSRSVKTLPASSSDLVALPGIGRYTAGAVSSFAFERRAALVDTNVARVLRRAFAPKADFKTTRGAKRIWQIAEEILPRSGKATWTHNQALIELGALVCTARIAHCSACPVRSCCNSGKRESGTGKNDGGKGNGKGKGN